MNEITFCKSGCCEVARVELGLEPYGAWWMNLVPLCPSIPPSTLSLRVLFSWRRKSLKLLRVDKSKKQGKKYFFKRLFFDFLCQNAYKVNVRVLNTLLLIRYNTIDNKDGNYSDSDELSYLVYKTWRKRKVMSHTIFIICSCVCAVYVLAKFIFYVFKWYLIVISIIFINK